MPPMPSLPHDPETLLFVRFRDAADVNALGELYDHTAPELLRVAMHLVHDPARAEDLVQQTFVAAIEAAERFDAIRRVRAWLLGILTNQARKLLRDEGRRPEGQPRAASDPLAAAQTSEFTAQIDEAISTLPDVYQPVLVLHLKHGLIAAEIAHALRRSPGTVRTQLMRALELLKKALPTSITLAACGLLTPLRGMAAVREVVMTNAARHVAAGVASSAVAVGGVSSWIGGALLMKKIVAALAVVVLALGLRLLWSGGDGAPPVAKVTAGGAVVAEAVLPQPEPTPAASVDREITRELQVVPTLGSLRYRFLWEEDRTPAAGVFVRCLVWGRQNPFFGEIETVTDAAGEVALTGIEPGKVYLIVDRSDGPDFEVRAGEESAGTFLIPRGITVDVTVQDEHELPIAGASVWLSDYGNGTKGHVVGVTNAAGLFTIRDAGKARRVAARAVGHAPTALLDVESEPGERKHLVLTMTGEAAALRGIVRDAKGLPCADARVWIGGFAWVEAKDQQRQRGTPPPFELRTDACGRFHAEGLPAASVALACRGFGSGTTLQAVPLRAGETSDIEVTLPAEATITGFVRDETGRGIAGASVGGGGNGSTDFACCSTTTANDGSFTLRGLSPRKFTLFASHVSLLSFQQELVLGEGEHRVIDIVLPASQDKDQVRGQLVDEHGKALANWVVDIEPGDREDRRWNAWLHTDADGRFLASGCPDQPLRIDIFDPDDKSPVYPLLAIGDIHRGGDDLRIVVALSRLDFAAMLGRVVDADGNAIEGAHVSASESGSSRSQVWPTDANGRFRAERLPARTYTVEIAAADHPRLRLDAHTLLPKQQLDLGTIVMLRGGRVALQCKGIQPPFWLASIHRLDGEQVDHITPSESTTSSLLAPGEYLLCVIGEGIAANMRTIGITEGKTTDVELTLEPGAPQTIEIREPKPGAWQRLDLAITDANAQCVWAMNRFTRRGNEHVGFAVCLGVGTYHVEGKSDTGLTGSATITIVNAATTTTPVVLALH